MSRSRRPASGTRHRTSILPWLFIQLLRKPAPPGLAREVQGRDASASIQMKTHGRRSRLTDKESRMPESVTPSARNPWKLTAIGMGLVAATALATGIVVASRSKPEDKPVAVQPAPAERARVEG